MNLPRSNDQTLTEISRQVMLADRMNYKRDRDVELVDNRLILSSPNGTRFVVSIDDLGVLSATAL